MDTMMESRTREVMILLAQKRSSMFLDMSILTVELGCVDPEEATLVGLSDAPSATSVVVAVNEVSVVSVTEGVNCIGTGSTNLHRPSCINIILTL